MYSVYAYLNAKLNNYIDTVDLFGMYLTSTIKIHYEFPINLSIYETASTHYTKQDTEFRGQKIIK